jgi:hypothetical protein
MLEGINLIAPPFLGRIFALSPLRLWEGIKGRGCDFQLTTNEALPLSIFRYNNHDFRENALKDIRKL